MKIGILSLTKNYTKYSYFTEITYLRYLKKELRKIGDPIVLTNKNLNEHDPCQFDCFFLTSYQINFYGGKPNEQSIRKWNFITECPTPIFQLFCDFQLPLVNFPELLKKTFNIDLNKLDSENFYLIHYCQDLSFIDWLKSKKFAFPLLKKNCYYFPISDFHYKYQDILQPIKRPQKDICYVGNFRHNSRTKILKKVGEYLENKNLYIYGTRWKDKKINFSNEIILNDPILEYDFSKVINKFFGQIVTYDNIGIKYKVDSTRLIDTIVSGSLPIIDKKLEYLDIPNFARKLLFENKKDLNRILKISNKERNSIIKKYQKYLKEKYSRFDFVSLVKEICEKTNI